MNQLPSVNTTIFLKNKSIIQCPGHMFRLNNEPSSVIYKTFFRNGIE
jgi:hypothetical protein